MAKLKQVIGWVAQRSICIAQNIPTTVWSRDPSDTPTWHRESKARDYQQTRVQSWLSCTLRLSPVLIVVLLVYPATTAQELNTHQQIAEHHAPIIFQSMNRSGPYAEDGRSDYIRRLDFDGDWLGANNWGNAGEDLVNPLVTRDPAVYWHVVETSTHYFVYYNWFYPRDHADLISFTHENDWEGAQFLISKNGEFGDVEAVAATGHGSVKFLLPYGSSLLPPERYDIQANTSRSVGIDERLLTNAEPTLTEYPRVCLFVEKDGHGTGGFDTAMTVPGVSPSTYTFEYGAQSFEYQFLDGRGIVYIPSVDGIAREPIPAESDVRQGEYVLYSQEIIWSRRYASTDLPGMLFDATETTVAQATRDVRQELLLKRWDVTEPQANYARPTWTWISLTVQDYYFDPATYFYFELPGSIQVDEMDYRHNPHLVGNNNCAIVEPLGSFNWTATSPQTISWTYSPASAQPPTTGSGDTGVDLIAVEIWDEAGQSWVLVDQDLAQSKSISVNPLDFLPIPLDSSAQTQVALRLIKLYDNSQSSFTMHTKFSELGTVAMPPISISGRIATNNSNPISSVMLSGFPELVSTAPDGTYSAAVPYGWTGKVTPIKSNYTFSPNQQTYTQETSSISGDDYVGTYLPPAFALANPHQNPSPVDAGDDVVIVSDVQYLDGTPLNGGIVEVTLGSCTTSYTFSGGSFVSAPCAAPSTSQPAYLRITDTDKGGLLETTFNVLVNGPGDAYEQNDTCPTARIIPAGLHTGLDVSELDHDWYAINVSAGDDLTISALFDEQTGDLDLRLFDSCGGTLVDSSDGFTGIESVSISGSPTGQYYYLQVYVSGAGTPTYLLDVQIRDNGIPPTQVPIALSLSGPEHPGGISATRTVRFSPSGQYLAARGSGSVIVYDTRTWQVARNLSPRPNSLDWSYDGQFLAWANSINEILTVYQTSDWTLACQIPLGDRTGNAVAFSPNSTRIAVQGTPSGDDAGFAIYDIVSCAKIADVAIPGGDPVYALDWGSIGIVVGGESSDAYVYNQNGGLSCTLPLLMTETLTISAHKTSGLVVAAGLGLSSGGSREIATISSCGAFSRYDYAGYAVYGSATNPSNSGEFLATFENGWRRILDTQTSDLKDLVGGSGTPYSGDWSSTSLVATLSTNLQLWALDDTTPPMLMLNSPTSGQDILCDGEVMIEGETSDTSGVISASYAIDSGSWTPLTLNVDGTFGQVISVPGAGVHLVQVVATDLAGLQQTANVSFVGTCSPGIAIAPAFIDYGEVSLGDCREDTIAVTNTGLAALQGTATTTPPFTIVSGGNYDLTSGASQDVIVAFCPNQTEATSGTVTFTGGDGAVAVLSGIGISSVEQRVCASLELLTSYTLPGGNGAGIAYANGSVYVGNHGEGAYRALDLSGQVIGGPWDLPSQSATGDSRGMTFDGTWLWNTESSNSGSGRCDCAYAFAPGESVQQATFDLPVGGNLFGIAWDSDRSVFWHANTALNVIYKLAPDGSILDTVAFPETNPIGLAYRSPDTLYVTYSDGGSPAQYGMLAMGVSGTLLGSYSLPPEVDQPLDLEWVGNELWVTDQIADKIWVFGCTAPAATLVAHWTFDELTGSILNDSSGNGNNGTIVDAIWLTGCGALRFDGDNDYVQTDLVLSYESSDSFTWEAVARFWEAREEIGCILGFEQAGAAELKIGTVDHPTQPTDMYAASGTDTNELYELWGPGLTASWDEWHSYALVKDAGAQEYRFYVDGVLSQSVPDASTSGINISSQLPLGIGCQARGAGSNVDKFLLGDIAEIRIWDGVLEENQLLDPCTVTSVDETSSLSSIAVLHSARPNPFNPRTSLRFELSESMPVRLAIYDVAGRLVRVLVDKAMEPGSHEVIWLGRDDRGNQVASGVYLYKLETGSFSQARRMSLLK